MLNVNPIKYLLAMCLLWLVPVSYADKDDRQYRIVLDAGSTKTLLYLYQYDYEDSMPHNINTLIKNRVSPGVADIDNQDLDEYLSRIFNQNLVSNLNNLVKGDGKLAEDAPLSRIQFYSTAGMRALAVDERDEKNRLITAWVKKWLADNLPYLKDTNLDVRTISGEEEAGYTWVATNYLDNHFGGVLKGVAELGGGSTQIAFANAKTPNLLIEVANKKYEVTGESYPLGQNVISKHLAQERACFLKGYPFARFTQTKGNAFSDVPNKYAGNYQACRDAAKAMIDRVANIDTPYANDVISYRLFSNFLFSAIFLKIEHDYSLQTLQRAAERYCSLTWEEAQAAYPVVNKEYLALYCMGAAYQGALLEDSYHFSDVNQTLLPQSSIKNIKVTWPIGVLVSQYLSLIE